MDISSSDYHQMMNTHTLEDVLVQQDHQQQQQEKKPRPSQETALKCPRCDSTNTKFCYYNNYSLSQPRYFCKGCRRYWTKGGSLRNVPVGGGCRKNKKSSSNSSSSSCSSSSSSSSSKRSHDHHPLNTLPTPPPPFSSFDPSDLTLAFARLHNPNPNPNPSPSFITTPYSNSALFDALRTHGTTSTTPSGFQGLYYDNCLGLDGGLFGSSVTTTTATITTTTANSHEANMDHHGEENKAFLGLQWQLGNLDAGRDYWNGVNSSSWHDAGLINSSLL